MKNLIKFLSLGLTLVLLGCGLFKKETKETKVVLVLFDVSGSTKKMRVNFFKNFEKILSRISHGDTIIADRITDASISRSDFFINDLLPPFSPTTTNPRGIKTEKKTADEKLRNKKRDISKRARDIILGTQTTPYTDILSALSVAERVFISCSKGKKILVIFSDMILDTPQYNFEKEKLTDTKIEEIIKKEQKNLSNLSGVKVYIVGATAETTDKYFIIQNFWRRYFEECGATLLKSDYGATLLRFEE